MRWLKALSVSFLVSSAIGFVSAACETQTGTLCQSSSGTDISGPSNADECMAACNSLACNWVASESRCEAITQLSSLDSNSDSTCFTCPNTPFLGDDKNVYLVGENPFGRVQLPKLNLGAQDSWTIGVRVLVENWGSNGNGTWSRIFDFQNSGNKTGGNGILLGKNGNNLNLHLYRDDTNVASLSAPAIDTGKWVWVMVSYDDSSNVITLSYDGVVVASRSATPRLKNINLNVPYLGQSHWKEDADASIRFSYFFLANKSFNSDQSQADRMIKMRGAFTSASDVLQAYDYHDLAVYATSEGPGSPDKLMIGNIDIHGRYQSGQNYDYDTSSFEIIGMKLKVGHSTAAHYCAGMYAKYASFKIDLRGTPYKIKGLPSEFLGKTFSHQILQNQWRKGPFLLSGWRAAATITCDAAGQYCYGKCGGYCGHCAFFDLENQGNISAFQLDWVTNGKVNLACDGDYYAENQYCRDCTVCGDEEWETGQCTWGSNRTCEACGAVEDCTKRQCTSASNQVCVDCDEGFDVSYNGKCTANWNEALVGLKCGETSIDIANFWTMISGRPHIDIHDNDDGVVQFRVGGVKSKGLEVVLVDKDSSFVSDDNKPIGVEIFIGSQEEPVIHISETAGGDPDKFADIKDTPFFSETPNVLTDAWIRAKDDIISVGTGVYGQSETELISYQLSTSKTINRAIMTYGYGDLECAPFPFEMNISAGDYIFTPAENWADDENFLPWIDRSYKWVSDIPDYLKDTVALKTNIRFRKGTTHTITGYGTLYYAGVCPGDLCADMDNKVQALGMQALPDILTISNGAKFKFFGIVLANETFTVQNTSVGGETDQVGAWFWAPRVNPEKVGAASIIYD